MTTPREWWIFKGTSDFYRELVLDDNCDKLIKQKPEGYYDIVQTQDTIEGGVHVIEHAAFEQVCRERDRYREALEKYRDGTCHGCAAEHGAPETAFDLPDTSDWTIASQALLPTSGKLKPESGKYSE